VKIIIETIPHEKQRYDTCGDYWTDENGTRQFRISEMGDERYEFLVALHEMVEQELCRLRGVTESSIDDFDMSHPDLDEPGLDPAAPYHIEHMTATEIEHWMAHEMGVDWEAYDAAVMAL
jgi:hypothetical protein